MIIINKNTLSMYKTKYISMLDSMLFFSFRKILIYIDNILFIVQRILIIKMKI